MSEQNYRTHARYIPLWHAITSVALLALVGGSIVNLVHSGENNRYSAALLLLVSLILVVIYWYTRWFALRAQDRAIRAEENLRFFILTGKPLDPRLRMSQVIALRFAPDEELVELVQRTIAENLSNRDIKKAIRAWKADHHRV